MNTRNTLLIGLTSFILFQARAEDSGAAKKDLAALQGEWTMVSGSSDGQPISDEMRTHMKRICKGDVATTMMGEQVFLKAKITLDPSQKPKSIDYEMTGGISKGKTQLGIYELAGDTFKSCISAPGDPRPKDFTSQAGDHRILSVWKREKAAAQPEQK